MTQALRVISVQRGLDPADFTLMSFGGAGGLHVCELAENLRMRQALVPANAGVLSAQGLIWAPPQREQIQALPPAAQEAHVAELARTLVARATRGLADEGFDPDQIRFEQHLDLRYAGQSFALSVPWGQSLAKAEADFHQAHERQYGHRLDLPVERVNVRVRAWVEQAAPPSPTLPVSVAEPVEAVAVMDVPEPVPVYERQQLGSGQQIQGPALIVEPVATTWLAPGWRGTVHPAGHLLLERLD